jgi:hypothetical protein
MYYVEYLFARNRFLWFGSIVVAIGILGMYGVFGVQHALQTKPEAFEGGNHTVPIDVIFGIAGYATCVMATMLAATLNRDRCHLPYMWTRPISRERIAFQYMAVDVVTIIVAYALVAGVAAAIALSAANMTITLSSHAAFHVVRTPETSASIVRYLALPLMWYAVVEVATSWNGFRGGAAAGMSWAVFWGLLILRALVIDFPAPLPQIVAALNLLNPLAYFTTRQGYSITLAAAGTHTIPLPYSIQTILAYGIFAAGCIVAAYAWKRMEV